MRPPERSASLLSLAVAGALLIPACGGEPDSASPRDGAQASPRCDSENPVAPARLREDVGFLAAPRLAGRFPGTHGDRAARRYVEDRFRCLGLEPGGEGGSYQEPFVTSEGDATANVIGVMPGEDPQVGGETIVVGAHHDHIGTKRGRVHPGANDNASGTAALMAVAAAMQEGDPAPRRTVVFVAFGGEETLKSAPYLEGSVRFVRRPPPGLSIEEVVYMVNIDMLGSYSATGTAYALGARRGTPARSAIRALRADFPGLSVRAGERPGKYESDFYSFFEAGVPYVFMHTPDPRCLHEPCDRPERLDYGRMASLVELTAGLTARLADSTTDLAAERDGVADGRGARRRSSQRGCRPGTIPSRRRTPDREPNSSRLGLKRRTGERSERGRAVERAAGDQVVQPG